MVKRGREKERKAIYTHTQRAVRKKRFDLYVSLSNWREGLPYYSWLQRAFQRNGNSTRFKATKNEIFYGSKNYDS
jgi:hypothetical protein